MTHREGRPSINSCNSLIIYSQEVTWQVEDISPLSQCLWSQDLHIAFVTQEACDEDQTYSISLDTLKKVCVANVLRMLFAMRVTHVTPNALPYSR